MVKVQKPLPKSLHTKTKLINAGKKRTELKKKDASVDDGASVAATTAVKKDELVNNATKKIKAKSYADVTLSTMPANSEPAPENSQQKVKQKRSLGKDSDETQMKAETDEKLKIQHPLPSFEPVPFDEKKFRKIVSVQSLKRITKSLKMLVEAEVKKEKNSIFSDFRYFLDVISFKIPNCPKRVVKLNLKHSIVDKDDDIAMIVPDLQRGSKVDYEPTIQHYEDLFREAGIEGLKIIPFNKLRSECNTYETVRKFSNTYDYFMCDGRIIGHVTGFCGKIFQKPRKTFHAVRMERKDIKTEIDKALHRTAFRQLQKGDMISIPVASHKQSTDEVAENVYTVVKQLKTLYAGGWENIRAMYMKVDIVGTSSLPIYVSMCDPPVNTPTIIGPREQRMLKLKKQANAVLSKFAVSKSGDIIKLTPQQVANKRKLSEAHSALVVDTSGKAGSEEPEDNDGDENVVPAKKPRKDKEETATEHEVKKKNVEKEEGGSDDESKESVEEGDSDEDNENEVNETTENETTDSEDSVPPEDEDDEDTEEDDDDDDEGDSNEGDEDEV